MPNSKQYLEQIKEQYTEYKKSVQCHHCGIKDHRLMEFHHIKPKKASVSRLVSDGYSWRRIQQEINNCIPLCCNCHRLEHWES